MKKMLSAEKAEKMLHDNSANGRPLTKKQRGFFGAVAGGNSKKLTYRKPVKPSQYLR